MWTVSYSQACRATPAQVWQYYLATDIAPQWDPLISEIITSEPMAIGVRGRNRPAGLRFLTVPFVYTEVTIEKSYTEVTTVPGATFAYTHDIVATADGCMFTHGVIVTGPLAWLYNLAMKRDHEAKMPRASRTLAQLVAQGTPAATCGSQLIDAAPQPAPR